MINLDVPFHFDGLGRTATTTHAAHIRQMIELLLFTRPGERVNRPTFGSGLYQLIFAPNSPELAAVVQTTTQALLQQYFLGVIEIQSLEVVSEEATLYLTLRYTLSSTGETVTESFQRRMAL